MSYPPAATSYTWDQLCPVNAAPDCLVNNLFIPPQESLDCYGVAQYMTVAPPDTPSPPPSFNNDQPRIDLGKLSTYLPELYYQLGQNASASQCLAQVVEILKQGFWPPDEYLAGFVLERPSNFCCVIPGCDKHLRGFDREDRAREHFLIDHLGSKHRCNMCSTECKRHQELLVHIRRYHSGQPLVEFVCEICHKPLANKGNLNRHLEDKHGRQPERRVRNKA